MSLYVLADLHLSINSDKPMDIFCGWKHYVDKLKENWNATVSVKDTVVLLGDISWGSSLEDSTMDFKFINELPGQKIILKGNHDYWWSTKSKMDRFFNKHNFSTLKILHNNSFIVDGICICGTRGWMFENGEKHNSKIINRELQRLRLSIQSGVKSNLPMIVCLHYPPIYGSQVSHNILEILNEYRISHCYYGHLHSQSANISVNGLVDNIYYQLVACDYVNFNPVKVVI